MTHQKSTAAAKINLSLHIQGQRPDGYHLLSGLVAFANYGDEIIVTPAKTISLTIDGPYGTALSTSDNLILRAAHLLQKHCSPPATKNPSASLQGAKIHLTKNLPIASGIGGGSSDAATTLLLLNTLWNCNLTPKDLAKIAQPLGADIPMCLHRQACYVSGIGTNITPIPPLPALHAVLVNPNIAVTTANIFAAGFSQFSQAATPPTFASQSELINWLKTTKNDLTANAISAAPIIQTVLDSIAKTAPQLTRMSGSGATCFGLYPTKKAAQTAASLIKITHPTWWINPVILH